MMKTFETLKLLKILKGNETPVTNTVEFLGNTLTRTNGRTTIIVKIDKGISRNSVFVPFNKLYEAVKIMGDNIETKDDNVVVRGGEFSEEIKAVEDMRIINLPVEPKYNVNAGKLLGALKKVSPAVTKDKDMKSLYGVLFSVEDSYLNVVAVDGFRLAISKIASKSTAKDIFISFEAIKALERTLRKFKKSNNPVIFGEGNGYGMIEFEDIKIVQEQDLEFPNYKRVMPEGSDIKTRVIISKESIMGFVETAAKLSGDLIPLSLNVKNNTLTLGIKNTYKEFKAQVNGERMEILFNPRFIYEALKTFEHSTLIIDLISPVKPALFYDSVKDTYHLIMPIRPTE